MRMVPACFRALAAGAVLAWVVAPALLSAAPAGPAAPDKDDKSVNPNEKLHRTSTRPITIKIDKQPLSLAVDMLREKSKVNIVLDSITIQQQLGFTPDQPPFPSRSISRTPRCAPSCERSSAPYGLSFAPIGDTVVVTTEDMAMIRQMRQRVSVDLSKVEFTSALKQMARETATNLILDARAEKEAEAKVSLQLEDVPLETAVRLLSEMANLKPVRVGNVLFVTKKDIANELRDDPDLVQPVQPGQPVPPGVFAPPGIAPNPPPTIVNPPVAPPGVPPAVADPTKPADANPPTEDKPKPPADDKSKTDDVKKDPAPTDKKPDKDPKDSDK